MSPDSAPLVAVSLTWREASSAMRARASAPLDPALYTALRAHGVEGLVEVHTCARSLWLAATAQAPWVGALLQSNVAARCGGEVLPVVYEQVDAARHALRVALGLDSYVQGESDIGGQFLAAFDAARAAGHSAVTLNLLQQSASRLLSEGREAGFVRPNRGLGQLAVTALLSRGVDLSVPVAVIGAGAIGGRVVASLRRAGAAPPTVYNRTPRLETLPLDQVAGGGHAAAVVCTAGPARWFLPGAGLSVVVDLGMPAQVADVPACVGLDALLAGDPLRLPDERLRAAEDAVEREIGGLLARVRTVQWQRGLAGASTLRDQFLDNELDHLLADATCGLSEDQQRKVRMAARGALRQYSHRMLTWIKQELSVPEENG
ncbi:MAG: hypothetical protein Q8P41_24790 [Pseudomonadota bacterium]|nr:hypothetical protein [Pseudomonadota bacterium]